MYPRNKTDHAFRVKSFTIDGPGDDRPMPFMVPFLVKLRSITKT